MPSLALACRLSAVSMALRRASSPPQFLPSSLFANGEQGYWYDNQDILNYRTLGENIVVNGDFSDGTAGWVVGNGVSVVGGELRVTDTVWGYNQRAKYNSVEGFPAGNYLIRAKIRNVSMTNFCQVQCRLVSGDTYVAGKDNLSTSSVVVELAVAPTAPWYVNILVDVSNTGAKEAYFDDIEVLPITISNCTMFQDVAGTIPVTAVEQPVALQLDKSGKGNHRIAPGPTPSRPILKQDANGIYYLDTDGTDDWMRTAATVDFSGSDKVTLVKGLHKRNDSASIFNELSANSNDGSAFSVVSGLNASYGRYSSLGTGSYTGDLGGNVAYFSSALHPAPDTAIISATHNISGDLSRIWRNNVVGIDGTANKGTGNFRNDYVYFYSRAGSTFRFNGRDYGQFAISRLLSDTERNQVESWLNNRMGGIY